MTSLVSALSSPEKVPTRSIVLLAVAGFASQAIVRVTDSLLPQIAIDFGTTVGDASIVVAAYAVGHGAIQLIIGPFGDRFGKYRTVATMCALATILVALCGTVQSLSAARRCALRLRRRRRLDHSALHGLRRGRDAVCAAATDPRSLSHGADFRAAVWPS